MNLLLKALALFLDEAVVVGLVLLVLWQVGVDLSPGVVAAVALLLGLWLFVLYRIVVSSFRRRQMTGREGMIGVEGKVVMQLNPEGVIRVRGELWTALSTGDSVAADEEVVVVGVKGFKLLVERKE